MVEALLPKDIQWELSSQAYQDLAALRQEMSDEEYETQKAHLRLLLVEYFRAEACQGKLGKTISPLGGSAGGGKILKVRWGLPGGGKSGGLRLVVVAYCSEKRVVIAAAFLRRDDPQDSDFETAVQNFEARKITR